MVFQRCTPEVDDEFDKEFAQVKAHFVRNGECSAPGSTKPINISQLVFSWIFWIFLVQSNIHKPFSNRSTK
jgi:hypothetical protein